jgi:hypothetical protein
MFTLWMFNHCIGSQYKIANNDNLDILKIEATNRTKGMRHFVEFVIIDKSGKKVFSVRNEEV